MPSPLHPTMESDRQGHRCYAATMTGLLTHKRRRADVAIDFGTANLVLGDGAGICFNEPSICCFSDQEGRSRLHAAGAEAHMMAEHATGPLRIARPLRHGVMSDIHAGREMIRYAVKQSGRRRAFRRARAIVGVPADATQAERQALLTAVRDAGVTGVRLLHEPLMAAIGAGLTVEEPRGRMLVDCGAGTTEVAVISLGGICLFRSVRIGGDTLDEAIIHLLHSRYRLDVGLRTAEKVKREIAAFGAARNCEAATIDVSGRSVTGGVPVRLAVPASDLLSLLARHAETVAEIVKLVLAETPPELSRDILEDGITLTGGASLISLLSPSIAAATGLEVVIADRPRDCVALGLARVLEEGR